MRYSELDDELRQLLFFPLDSVDQVGPWSRRMRAFTGTTSQDVAEAMGGATSRSTVCSIERGAYQPKTNTVIELAGAHGCQIWVVRRGIDFA